LSIDDEVDDEIGDDEASSVDDRPALPSVRVESSTIVMVCCVLTALCAVLYCVVWCGSLEEDVIVDSEGEN
jgi:hypothetical protein